MKRRKKSKIKFHHLERKVVKRRGRVRKLEQLFMENEKGEIEKYGEIDLTMTKRLLKQNLTDDEEPRKGVFFKAVLGKYGVTEAVQDQSVKGVKIRYSGVVRETYWGWKKGRGGKRKSVRRVREARRRVTTRVILKNSERSITSLESILSGRLQSALAAHDLRASTRAAGGRRGLSKISKASIEIWTF